MKMKNLFVIMGLATAVVLSSCGGGKAKEEEAARKKREADSLAALEQKRQDSIAAANQAVELKNVVETIQADPQFSTLVELLGSAGLIEKLSDANANFTVFAPTNDAFAKMDQRRLNSLRTDLKRRQELTDLLTYHVAAGKFAAADLRSRPELDMLDEKVLKLDVQGDNLRAGGANVTTADIQGSNGVIHVLDGVMTPPARKGKAKPAPTTTTTTETNAATTPTTNQGGAVGGKQTGAETPQVGGKQTEAPKVGGKAR